MCVYVSAASTVTSQWRKSTPSNFPSSITGTMPPPMIAVLPAAHLFVVPKGTFTLSMDSPEEGEPATSSGDVVPDAEVAECAVGASDSTSTSAQCCVPAQAPLPLGAMSADARLADEGDREYASDLVMPILHSSLGADARLRLERACEGSELDASASTSHNCLARRAIW
eukprot:scaffold217113_cov36-Tisochrysis_lutea.AAC.2